MRLTRRLANLLIAVVLLGSMALAGRLEAAKQPFWPRFNGPNGDNLSPDTGLLTEWPEDGPKFLWTAKDIGDGFSSVSLAGGRIYTSRQHRGDRRSSRHWTWTARPFGRPPTARPGHADHPGLRSTPTVDGDRLYDESPLGELACLEPKTASRSVALNILKKFDANEHQLGTGRVAPDRRHARDLLSRRAADRRGGPGQGDRRSGLEIAQRRAPRPATPRPP